MSKGLEFRRRTGFLLATLGRRTESTWTAFLRGRGITNAEFAAMAVLVDESPTQGELAALLGIDPRNAGPLVRRLTARGWASTGPNPADRRSTIVSVTTGGRQAWEDLQRDLRPVRHDYLAALAPDEQTELERLLNKLNDFHLGRSDRPTVPPEEGRGMFTLEPVGLVRDGRGDPAETDHWGDVVSTVELDARFGDDCLIGLTNFSHVEVLYVFHLAEEREDYTDLRRSRGRDDLPPVGVFSDRGPRRPNRLGATVCAIVEASGRTLRVRGLDAVVGTPVVDVKPVMREFLPGDVEQPEWASRLMSVYFTD